MTDKENGWSEDEINILVTSWRAGMFANDIAKKLPGRSSQSIFGKIKRLRDSGVVLAQRSDPYFPRGGPRSNIQLQLASRPVRDISSTEKDPGPMHPPINTRELRDNHCRWPYDGKEETIYCGCQQEEGSPYCSFHTELAKSKKLVAA